MAFTSSGYNGWSTDTRNVRGKISYSKKKARATNACELCGQTEGPFSWHAEEYGSSLKDFLDHEIELCAYCHGMIHARYSKPGRFERFKRRLQAIRSGAENAKPLAHMKSISEVFQNIFKLKDVPRDLEAASGVEWLDSLVMTKYDGPPKLAVVTGDDHHILLPDPRIYKPDHPEDAPPIFGILVTWVDGGWTYETRGLHEDGSYRPQE